MELYKLRYNLYNYLIDNNTNYILTYNNKYFWQNLFIVFIILSIIIIIYDYSQINEVLILFIIFSIIIIYLIFKLDNNINIINNNDFLNHYINYFRLFNIIFIDSFINNNINNSFKKSITDNTNEDALITKLINYIKTQEQYNNLYIISLPHININTEISLIFSEIDINELSAHSINYIKFIIINTGKIYIKISRSLNENNELNIIYSILEQYKKYYLEQVYYYNSNKDYYLIELDKFIDKMKTDKPLMNINNIIIDYFNNKDINIDNIPAETNTNDIFNNDKHNYFILFYTTLAEIRENIKYNDNIPFDNLENYTNELIQNNNILKFINIYNNKYYDLKKYILIDNKNKLFSYIHDNYEHSRNKYLDDDNNKQIYEVIEYIDNLKCYLIDLEIINSYYIKKNKHLNEYINDIYDNLLIYYNNKLNITLENFDILYKKKETKIEENIRKSIDNFNSIFYYLIIFIIIYMTIIMHFFYIEFSRFIL